MQLVNIDMFVYSASILLFICHVLACMFAVSGFTERNETQPLYWRS